MLAKTVTYNSQNYASTIGSDLAILHNNCNIVIHDLADMYALSGRPVAQNACH